MDKKEKTMIKLLEDLIMNETNIDDRTKANILVNQILNVIEFGVETR